MELLNLREVRDLLGFKSHKMVYRMIDDGLPVIHLGRNRFISKDDLETFLKSHTVVNKGGI